MDEPKCWRECKWNGVTDGTQPCKECYEGNDFKEYSRRSGIPQE